MEPTNDNRGAGRARPEAADPSPRPRVLIVDDEPPMREAVSRALRGAGFATEAAADAAGARELLARRDYEVALLDVRMPGTDGIALAALIRGNEATRRLPILMLTASGEIEAVERALAAGADDYLLKPPRYRELTARVRAAAERYRAIRNLDDAEGVLMSLARAVEAKDGTTADHCDRLARLAVILGRELGVADPDLEALRRAGVLHDVGKVGIPDAVLLKPGRLDEAEWRVMRRHVTIGAELLAPLRTMARTLPIVRHHHERGDGSGYPDGLRGEQIPFLARVFQVVDVYDALTSVRPYKPAMSAEAALRILGAEAERGWWEPAIVATFAALVRKLPAPPAPRGGSGR